MRRFFRWAHQRQLDLSDIGPVHIAGHASVGTPRIYDHRAQKVAQEEIERVRI